MKEHRGTLILVLGILGLVICAICAPFAWIMGKNDLAEIAAGTMDPAGEGTTKAGMICGIIGTVFLVLGLLWAVFVVVLGVGAAAAGAG